MNIKTKEGARFWARFTSVLCLAFWISFFYFTDTANCNADNTCMMLMSVAALINAIMMASLYWLWVRGEVWLIGKEKYKKLSEKDES